VTAALALALVARQGTSWFRLGALAGELLLLGAALVGWWLDARGGLDARRLVRQVIVRTDRALGERALRATRLVQRLAQETRDSGTNALLLATSHLDRVIEGASLERVRVTARRRARVYRWLGTLLALVLLLLAARRGREIIEGLDVLATRGTRAPWPMFWTDQLRIQAQPPAYLRSPARRLFSGATSMLPRGTQLTLRARPLYDNRQLVIVGARGEAPFVSDGEGGLVAHYTVQEDDSLVVAARFGDVLIVEPEELRVVALSDAAPSVVLEEAPKTYQLRELSRLELRWAAQDDHGLRQVDLVLRSGNREERRMLATYDDEAARQSGGHVLSPNDPFLRSLYLPALVSIEARDNDPVGGSKWGKSQAITIVPTAVGELDALRYLALVRSRDRFVDALAVAAGEPSTVAPAEQRERFAARLDAAVSGLEHALADSYGGLRVPARLRTFALGRLRLLKAAQDTPAERARALEGLILVLDGVLGSFSSRDAQRVAKVLGNVAEEAMVGAQQAVAGEAPEPGLERLDKAIYALRAGAQQLLSLGSLGNDLGSVALADLGRVVRGRERGDLYHAELAAEHLARRLRRPSPSFGAASSGGVEAGQGRRQEPSPDAAQEEGAFDELAQRLSELARQHAGALEQVDQALSASRSQPEDPELRAEAERRADQIREAVEQLPEPGNSPGTAEASGALAREHARAMAHELEGLKLEQAAESAQRSLGAIAEAGGGNDGATRLQRELAAARAVVEEQLRWVQEQLEARREAARERARESLQGPASLEEELAGAATELARRGDERETPLPGEITERLRQADQLMRQAARDLRSGEGESGLSLQRQAQRLLEDANQGKTDDPEEGDDPQRSEEEGNGRNPDFKGDVPAAEEQNRTEEFRRRVLKNLGNGPSGRLAPAVKRYAEGLLR
jgi:hypothetical protein